MLPLLYSYLSVYDIVFLWFYSKDLWDSPNLPEYMCILFEWIPRKIFKNS